MIFYSKLRLKNYLMHEKPFEKIKKNLQNEIPEEIFEKLPSKWEKIGEVLTIVLPQDVKSYKKTIAEAYASVLGCKTVLNDTGSINGEYREPNVELLYGSKNTETIHIENGIRYKLDPQKIMFSSGNMDERIRMAHISNSKETVVDLFAGIGYFTLPIAVHSKSEKIFACEKNPVSFDYLCQNITLNNVSSIVEPLQGDNRRIAPKNVADRVIMGYFGDTHQFLPVAFDCLKNHCGIIHYHDKFADVAVPKKAVEFVKNTAEKYDRKINLLNFKCVKSYAPGISHYVFDVKVGEK